MLCLSGLLISVGRVVWLHPPKGRAGGTISASDTFRTYRQDLSGSLVHCVCFTF